MLYKLVSLGRTMNLPSPDFLTAFSMAALTAFTVSWVMWALGKHYWKQGMSWAVISTLLYAFAYISFLLQNILEWFVIPVISKLFISFAIATFTVALERFCQSTQWNRDCAVILIPIFATLTLAISCLPQNIAWFNMLQSVITVLQTIYTILVLFRMRSRTPGTGWLLVSGGALIHLATILPLMFIAARPNPEFTIQASTQDILAMWAICLILFLKMVVMSFGFLIMLRDRQAAIEEDKARLDYLTQLPNRATLVEAIREATLQASKQLTPLSLMVIDIDHFKKFNDEYGHLAGDRVIQVVAQILRQQCREMDLAARYGGEEFILLLPHTTLDEAHILAERLCHHVRSIMVDLDGTRQLNITISVGVHCCIPTQNSTWESLVAVADEAMYLAKQRGRDRVVLSNSLT
ncbi:GGDEF domain-containing protein [Acinetobacter piscicola]|uniref:diguanylate cyclase n=2 Tax=Moraxellaceae TaxID=468 RepID=A0A4V1W115_9GAMM|nr:GGDEF domain-containing protein [Acinetobacter piscicola]RYL24969.1 GGDEF domain-containing protein [Acinetobacter piscicola]